MSLCQVHNDPRIRDVAVFVPCLSHLSHEIISVPNVSVYTCVLVTDSSKFGQRMLEKMGWSKGKGLGANEDGMTEPIRQSGRIAQEGLGWEEKNNNPELNANYEQALAHLQKHHASASQSPVNSETETRESEPEPTAKREIRVRHRYGKILRAKDTSSYSKEDMAKIFAVRMDGGSSTTGSDSCQAPHSLGQEWRSLRPTNNNSNSEPEELLAPQVEDEALEESGEPVQRKEKRKKRKKKESLQETGDEKDHEDRGPDCERSGEEKRDKKKNKKQKKAKLLTIATGEPEESCDATEIPSHANHLQLQEDDESRERLVNERRKKNKSKHRLDSPSHERQTSCPTLDHEEASD